MDNIFDLLASSQFWILWFVAVAFLGFLGAAALTERRFATRLVRGRVCFLPPGVWSIPFGNHRALEIGDPTPSFRFVNPKGFVAFLAHEPSQLLWPIGVCCLWLGAADFGAELLLCLAAYRFVLESRSRFSDEGLSFRIRRAVVKLLFSAASGVHYACLCITALGLVMVVMVMIGMGSARGESNRRSRRS